MIKYLNHRNVLLLCLALGLVVFRLFLLQPSMNPVANFSPMGAIMLLAGIYLRKPYIPYGFSLFVLFLSDIIVSQAIYPQLSQGLLYKGWYWNYAGLLSIVWIGKCVSPSRVKALPFFLSVAAGTVFYFIISNFGVWLGGGVNVQTGVPFEKNWSGLMECYLLAIPFIRNFFFGTLVYGSIGVLAVEYIFKKMVSLQPSSM